MGSQLLANANNEWISSLASLAGSAIVFHDHLITVSQEVQFVWGRRWTSVNLLFYLNRWITLLWACLNVAILFPMVSPNVSEKKICIKQPVADIFFEQGLRCHEQLVRRLSSTLADYMAFLLIHSSVRGQ
ncbi:hypothetical protein OBBRIDRAFT_423876 [Obba rivulosa]|uniref:DUF6533 domain-containing protein n=1 Tax=Obba rivulosa TaxID=1052685 RepID=A0A8E2B0T6_9APHY|nr:hypothetical protein OBBRIDRAFT_423876 [Obba rivulosa]